MALAAVMNHIPLGLIAGNGRFPFLALEGARRLGHALTVVAILDETSPALEEAAALGAKATGEEKATEEKRDTAAAAEEAFLEEVRQRAGRKAAAAGAKAAKGGGSEPEPEAPWW